MRLLGRCAFVQCCSAEASYIVLIPFHSNGRLFHYLTDCDFLGPIHQFLDTLPLLGDTTTNQVLLFSPPFSPPSISQPTYPNYTLPSANLTFPSEPSSPPDWALFIAPTSSPAFASLPRTGCAMRAAAGNVGFYKTSSNSEGLWLRDSDGWRWQWFINGLTPQTNYTVYGVTNGTQVSGPIYFVTKSGGSTSFPYDYIIPMNDYLQLRSRAPSSTLSHSVPPSPMQRPYQTPIRQLVLRAACSRTT